MSDPIRWALAIAAAYIFGSIPFGFIIGLLRGIDIRQHGSKNIGATNVMRVLGKRLGILCFALDVLKGALPVFIAAQMFDMYGAGAHNLTNIWLWLAVAAGAIAGHMFSIFLRFKGGKGVATGFGAMLALYPIVTMAAACALAIWIFLAFTTRYVSLSSIAAAMVLPIAVAAATLARNQLDHAWPFILCTALLGAMVIWKHRANIARLRAGTENRIGRKTSPPTH